MILALGITLIILTVRSSNLPSRPNSCLQNYYLANDGIGPKLKIQFRGGYFASTMNSGQSYKYFTLVNYDSRVVLTRYLPILRLQSRNLQA